MLSGGEPAVHPQFEEILDVAARSSFLHCVVITNGVRIATDPELVERIGSYNSRVEVYLQFDSLRAASLSDLRGIDLTEVRRNALTNLERAAVPTTLVAVIKKGVNDGEVGEIIQAGLSYDCVRGVTHGTRWVSVSDT
jgi:uncharacterized radical SAM superfamily Fe-S cluster-containing enzyme